MSFFILMIDTFWLINFLIYWFAIFIFNFGISWFSNDITEKKEKYKNNKTGIEKLSHQKLLDGKGTKVIKKINLNNGDKEEHNIYKGIKENNVKDFNKKYNSFKEKVKLDDMFQKVKLLGNKRKNEKTEQKILLIGDGKEPKINTRSTRSKNKKK